MLYLVEVHKPTFRPAYVMEQADTEEAARAIVDARLGRDDDNDDAVIVAVHAVH